LNPRRADANWQGTDLQEFMIAPVGAPNSGNPGTGTDTGQPAQQGTGRGAEANCNARRTSVLSACFAALLIRHEYDSTVRPELVEGPAPSQSKGLRRAQPERKLIHHRPGLISAIFPRITLEGIDSDFATPRQS